MDFGVARSHEARVLVREYAQKLGAGGSDVLDNLKPGRRSTEVVMALADDLDADMP